MKAFGIWLAGFAAVFGLYGGITHTVRDADPERVFVVVDSSFQMREVWGEIAGELDRIDDRRYSEFSLATEKRLVHSWQGRLTMGAVDPFAPCGFDRVADYSQASEADRVVVITTPGSCPVDALPDDWAIVELEP